MEIETELTQYKVTESGCWEWTGKYFQSGYGVVRDGKKYIRAHRLSWSLANGKEIPEGMVICHKCDNRPCINPDHLFLGTQQDNIRDAVSKGRMYTPSKDKTHCPLGHEYTEENTYHYPGKLHRICRICATISRKKYLAKTKGALK